MRGRNGISFQWKGQEIDEFGYSTELACRSDDAQIFAGRPGRAIKTEGTNCAFRREVLAEMGGFDPAFRYYLDEADVNMRLAARGMRTAIVPKAEVHHCYEASEIRRQSRMPISLFEIGASQAVFLKKHAPPDQFDKATTEFGNAQRAALIRHMVAGNCEPSDVNAVMATFQAGLADGARRDIAILPRVSQAADPFLAFRQNDALPDHKIFAGFRVHSARLRQRASQAVRQGHNVSLYLFSRTALFHRVVYRDGYWEQTGGLFGRAERTEPFFRFTSLKHRLEKETQRVASRRDPLDTANQTV